MLKKFFMVLVAAVLIIIAISSIGPMIGLAVSLIVLYFSYKQYRKSISVWGKLLWGVIGVIALFSGIGNLPALAGVLAAYVLYVCYKKWKSQKDVVVTATDDPFTNFENQWNKMTKF